MDGWMDGRPTCILERPGSFEDGPNVATIRYGGMARSTEAAARGLRSHGNFSRPLDGGSGIPTRHAT
jgi:hypothetical protein